MLKFQLVMNKELTVTIIVTGLVLGLYLWATYLIKSASFFPLDSIWLNILLAVVYICVLFLIINEFSGWLYQNLKRKKNNNDS